jgi:chromosome segregation ATPase
MDTAELKEWMGQRFTWLDREIKEIKSDLREVKAETKKTNGRTTENEKALLRLGSLIDKIGERVDALPSAAPDLTEAKELVDEVKAAMTSGENRLVRVWHVALVLGTIVVTIAVLSFFDRLKKPSDVVTPAPAAVIR